MSKLNLLVFFFLLFTVSVSFGATVDSLDIQSPSMNRTYKAAVVLPASYVKSKASYPVLYLLHGGGGHFSDWLKHTPDKMLVKNLSDRYNIIIVMPEGEVFGWYLNSTIDKQSQFETHITKEVITKIDNTYRTVKDRKGRVITGLSMGGHGALYLSTRHPNLFAAAGSMSGAVDMNTANWTIPQAFRKNVKERFQKVVGDTTNIELYDSHSVINMVPAIRKGGVRLIIDCGVKDFLIEPNRELHRRLVYAEVPHDYTERPGAHTWEYWENALPYHVMFFQKVFRENGVSIE